MKSLRRLRVSFFQVVGIQGQRKEYLRYEIVQAENTDAAIVKIKAKYKPGEIRGPFYAEDEEE